METKSLRYFCISQILFACGLFACIIIDPHGTMVDDGISYYGVHITTLAPYLIALVGGAVFSALTGHYLPRTVPSVVKKGFIVFAIFIVGVAITPYDIGTDVHVLHDTFGSLLFASQLALTGWLAFWRTNSRFVRITWVLQLIAGIVSGIYLFYPGGYLFLSQVTFQVCFGIGMYATLRELEQSAA